MANSLNGQARSLSFIEIEWMAAERPPALDRDEVHLWWLPLQADEATMQRFLDYLGPLETTRMSRFSSPVLQQEYIAGRGLLYELISAYLGRAPEEISLNFGLFGKPYVPAIEDSGPRLCFNYSDASGMGVFAFSWDREVGVDLEWIGRRGRFEQISRRRFSESEHAALTHDTLSATERAERFLACWTRKEGYGKARGVGIRYPLHEVEVCNDCELPVSAVETEVGHWLLRQVHLPPDHIGCLVHEGREELPVRGLTTTSPEARK